MSSLFGTLGTAGRSLGVLEKAISVVQNNVTNATTPGYVTQTLQFAPQSFDPGNNLWGGVEATGVQSARDVYAEQAVWTASQRSGLANSKSSSLDSLQKIFDVSGKSGVPAALSNLYSAFSAWSSSPADTGARQKVLTAAQNLATSFSQTFTQAQQISSDTDQKLRASVDRLNQFSSQIATINSEIRRGSGQDGGLQAQLYNALEQVSTLAPVNVHFETDGTATVLLGNQSPLVLGETHNDVKLNYVQSPTALNPGAAPSAQLLSADNHDLTALVDQGTLGGVLDFRNNVLPSVLGDGQQQGSLNQLAQGVADRINTVLSNGQISAGPPAVPGVPLFTYNAATPTGVAGSLAVDPNVTTSQLAAIDPGPPVVANGVASKLAALVSPQSPQDMINGFSYTQFYGAIASGIGQQATAAAGNASTTTNLLNQAQSLRAQVSGVSLNDQATKLIQFQQAYQASAQLISVIKEITQSLMQVLR
jgi:flagellar hook-associated protein 1 FlgK